jgi:outer membrane protein
MKKVSQMISVFALIAFAGGLSASALADEVKIGVVDMQKALQTVESGKKAKTQLEKEINAKKKELQTEEAAIKKMHDEYKKQTLALSDEARARKQGEIQERVMQLQKMMADSQQELQAKETELTRPIVEKLRGIIADIAKQKGFTVVLEKNENTVLFSQEKDDFTNEVISVFNKKASASLGRSGGVDGLGTTASNRSG